MNEFVASHRNLVISTLYLVCALLFCGYTVFYLDRQQTIADLRKINTYLNDERSILEKHFAALTKEQQGTTVAIRSLSGFLNRINDISKKNDIIIRKLLPDPQDHIKFTIEILVDYYKFLHFAADLESLDTTITNLQVHPYSMGEMDKDNRYKSLPQHVITFSMTPRNDAEPITGERLAALEKMVDQKEKRNPFQRFAFDAKQRMVNTSVDLTWIYRLTGTGRDQVGQYATIDRKDYYEGYLLDGKKIEKIQADRVLLTEDTANGKQSFVLKFRATATDKQ
ncbi:conserved hypothetical protein [Gammaproteobacteria bacterium]